MASSEVLPEPVHPEPRLYYEAPGLRLYHGDSTDLACLPDGVVDLIVTSPPYNLDMPYDGYRDALPYERYLVWVERWARALYRVAAWTGRACINVPLDTNKGGKRAIYVDYVARFRAAGWTYQTTIVWNEQNLVRRQAWGSWLSPAAPFATAPVEMIAVFHKGPWRRPPAGRQTDLTREEFLAWTLGLWSFPGEPARRAGWPAAFPAELPRRLIKLYSYVGDLVLDLFMGSGTTCLVARQLGRRAVGIDIAETACALARRRCAGVSGRRPLASAAPVAEARLRQLSLPLRYPRRGGGRARGRAG